MRIPLGRLVVITGVSGSGQIDRGARCALRQPAPAARRAPRRAGAAQATARRRAPQRRAARAAAAAGRSSSAARPCAGSSRSTACWKWTRHRSARRRAPAPRPTSASGTTSARIFAGTTEARIRGYTASRFSFNTAGGRCEACEGQGVKTIEMSFLPDVKVLCDVCGGRRFNSETLSVLWREKSIGDVLAMGVDDAVEFFHAHPRVHHALKLLQDVGLGLSDARPAEPDALGRRGAAHQAGHRARQGADGSRWRHRWPAPEPEAHAVCARTSRPSACTWRMSRS